MIRIYILALFLFIYEKSACLLAQFGTNRKRTEVDFTDNSQPRMRFYLLRIALLMKLM